LVGKTAVFHATKPMAYAGYLVRLRTNERGHPEYVSAVLNSNYGKAVLRGMCKSIVGMANINAKEVQTIPIAQPPFQLQSRFASQAAQVRKMKGAQQAALVRAADYERFKAKALQFLKAHENDNVIHKLRWNEPLTPADLAKLETMLVEAGTGSNDDVDRAKKESLGLGLFVRSLVGLDREAAKQAFNSFLQDKALSANQIDFIDLIIDHLTQRGWMDASALYESPFVDYSTKGVDGLFNPAQVDKLVAILNEVRLRAAA
jgi:hypothetical protein